jgi:hypothetical protein
MQNYESSDVILNQKRIFELAGHFEFWEILKNMFDQER